MPRLVPSPAPAPALLSISTNRKPPLRSYLELGALPTAVPCARLHAGHVLWEAGRRGRPPSPGLAVTQGQDRGHPVGQCPPWIEPADY
jgi:hypothetical protein